MLFVSVCVAFWLVYLADFCWCLGVNGRRLDRTFLNERSESSRVRVRSSPACSCATTSHVMRTALRRSGRLPNTQRRSLLVDTSKRSLLACRSERQPTRGNADSFDPTNSSFPLD